MRDSVVAKFATTASDGKTYQMEHYNLDAIISVGYRVNSIRGTQLRIWATHGHTATELIYQRADANEPNMGVTNYPGNTLLKKDVKVAKNYLSEEELNILNRMVTAYLELTELQAVNQQAMTMQEWAERLNQRLTMTGRELLNHAGKMSHDKAIAKAHAEYDKFKQKQLQEPTEVEEHFVEAEAILKQLEADKKAVSMKLKFK